MKIGEMIDLLYTTRAARLALSTQVNEHKAEETRIRELILAELDAQGMAKASGLQATCGVKSSLEPVVTDWEAIQNYIKTEDRFDLLQKRLSPLAWRELLEAGIMVPGTESIKVRDLSLTKSSRA